MGRRSVIAIDGPVASGKTTVGKLVSEKLGVRFLDTGLMYRGLAWRALRDNIPSTDGDRLGALARNTRLRPSPDGRGLLVNDKVLVEELCSPEVEGSVSHVAEVLAVRQAMVQQQREIAREGSIVMVGRDIGTDVLPDADLKIYLVASPQARARRRFLQMKQQGSDPHFDQVLQELEARDRTDSQRTHSPLRLAPDACLVDTDRMDVDQVVENICALAKGIR